ncbi:uncharacterized protein EAE97_009598 [Botrytis byssoidea]|uniref:Uncharacterized protein n=1 Tax=Botrytis byssoidea TaxID=139641 RepID=A0A9P5I2S9_9HELO|nr:uncharacterized protein EAE97_009598 [Botrytis byssoidea]KAF7930001.1 hypothetical protein EAE97_009598 [Botrytis byssoidea]
MNPNNTMSSNSTDNFYVGITSKNSTCARAITVRSCIPIHDAKSIRDEQKPAYIAGVSIAFFFIIIFAIAIQNLRARIASNRSMDEQRRVEEGRMTKVVQQVTGSEMVTDSENKTGSGIPTGILKTTGSGTKIGNGTAVGSLKTTGSGTTVGSLKTTGSGTTTNSERTTCSEKAAQVSKKPVKL